MNSKNDDANNTVGDVLRVKNDMLNDEISYAEIITNIVDNTYG